MGVPVGFLELATTGARNAGYRVAQILARSLCDPWIRAPLAEFSEWERPPMLSVPSSETAHRSLYS